MHCLISPSPALSWASTTVRPPSKLPTAIWRASRPAPSFVRLKLRHRPGETVALGPRCLVVGAKMNHGREAKLPSKPNHFVKEIQTITRRSSKLSYDTDEDVFPTNDEAKKKMASVAAFAAQAVIMASELADSGNLTSTGLSCKICADTVERTLGAFVNVFLDISEDCYNRTFDKDTVIKFLDALIGLASISHILLEDALEALSHTDPRESLLESSDAKEIHCDFKCQMDGRKYAVLNPKASNSFEVVTIFEAVNVTDEFLVEMMAWRQSALEKACGGSK